MKLSEVKHTLENIAELTIQLPDGNNIPQHFHVTEIGTITKHFIDCGGTIRTEKRISFQLWDSNDLDHRLEVEKLSKIIALSELKLDLEDGDIEVEYQGSTIGKYGLNFEDGIFQLSPTFTDCLAKDNCGIPEDKTRMALSDLGQESCCGTNASCC